MTARRFLAAALATIAAGALLVAWHERQTSRWSELTDEPTWCGEPGCSMHPFSITAPRHDTGSVTANLATAACVVMALLFGAALVWPATFGLGA